MAELQLRHLPGTVIFYQSLNLIEHVETTCKLAFFHLHKIAKIRHCLSQNDTETLVHASITSKFDISINTQVIIQNRVLSLARYLGLSADNHLDRQNGCQ